MHAKGFWSRLMNECEEHPDKIKGLWSLIVRVRMPDKDLESTRIRICLIDRLWSSYRYISGTATAYITCPPLFKEVSLRPYVVLGPFLYSSWQVLALHPSPEVFCELLQFKWALGQGAFLKKKSKKASILCRVKGLVEPYFFICSLGRCLALGFS